MTSWILLAWLEQLLALSAAPVAPQPELQLAAPLSATSVALAMSAQEEEAEADDDEGRNSGLSYSFIEVGATRFNLDAIDDDADTYYGLGSIGLFNHFYGFVGYENQSVDFDDASTDLWSLGLGAYISLTEQLHAVADAAWLYSELDGDTISEEDSGFKVRAGGRWRPIQLLEAEAHAIWYELDDSLMSDDSFVGFDASARLHLGPFSLGAMYEQMNDDDKVGINGRFSF